MKRHIPGLHCEQPESGDSLEGTVAIAYLYWCRGWDLEDAGTYVKKHWQCSTNVEAVRRAVWNSAETERARKRSS